MPSSVELEVIVEVVVKVSSKSRVHSVLVRMGGWVGGVWWIKRRPQNHDPTPLEFLDR